MKQSQLSEKKVGKGNKEVIGKATCCKPSQQNSSENFFRLSGSPIQFKCIFSVTEALWSVDIFDMVPLSLRQNYSKYYNKLLSDPYFGQNVKFRGNFKNSLFQLNKPDKAQEKHLSKNLSKN